MNEVDPPQNSTIALESVKVVAESMGISSLTDEAAKLLADDLSYRLRLIIQVNSDFSLVKSKKSTNPPVRLSAVARTALPREEEWPQ